MSSSNDNDMITTKKGDKGDTSLFDGTRVGKDDARIELNGELDELNALLGVCKATALQVQPYERIQRELMMVMTMVAAGTTGGKRYGDSMNVLSDAVERMEIFIEECSRGRKFDFVLPGQSLPDAYLHVARTKVRTCERRLVALLRHGGMGMDAEVAEVMMRYLNRLSDYLFCLTMM